MKSIRLNIKSETAIYAIVDDDIFDELNLCCNAAEVIQQANAIIKEMEKK